ncbi:MAG TPA: uracil-DNA glycosylase family protein [Polyangiaceae bacterium]|nr:uracil-DNA glycosylase family protein [Polyangiaceae bacterium]
MSLVAISRELAKAVRALSFAPPVAYVYHPLDYAWDAHAAYLERWGRGKKQVILLGMNPGPFGMVQTGVPFGDVALVRDWLGVHAKVKRPAHEHPARPVLGFDCPRSEVSGRRLWGFARATFGTPERFFERFFVVNYCPLAFMEESGKNRTPDKLPKAEQAPLFAACDRALSRIVDELEPEYVIGVGAFAEARARQVLGERDLRVGCILHPSPASPRANQGWERLAAEELRQTGIFLPESSPTRGR